ncbi:MAG TPA: hypothetical protein DIC35_03730 [Candidatus Moranbacteria bacterium]|nr:hypothetical protein [Candidatus Moranbacteria bacterium]
MNPKFKLLFFALGGIIFLSAGVFLWYRYSREEVSPEKQAITDVCNQSLGNCIKKKEEISKPLQTKENIMRPEPKPEEKRALPESNNNNSDSTKDPDESSSENIKKFDSDEDEEETNDEVTVEVEPDDE